MLLGEAHRLKFITGQFLDFAKPQSLLFRPCAVRSLVEETLRLLEQSGEWHKRTRWTVRDEAPDTLVLADADQFRQVVWNLCLNAVQAMPDGGTLTVAIRSSTPDARVVATAPRASAGPPAPPADRAGVPRLAGEPASREWVEIAFQDTGKGMTPAELQRVFDPFFTTRPSGTGLGLAIARKILDSMGGHIGVESSIGVGTTFRVWLRRALRSVDDRPHNPRPRDRRVDSDQTTDPGTTDRAGSGVRSQ
jgi:signal transduction histidine kinase